MEVPRLQDRIRLVCEELLHCQARAEEANAEANPVPVASATESVEAAEEARRAASLRAEALQALQKRVSRPQAPQRPVGLGKLGVQPRQQRRATLERLRERVQDLPPAVPLLDSSSSERAATALRCDALSFCSDNTSQSSTRSSSPNNLLSEHALENDRILRDIAWPAVERFQGRLLPEVPPLPQFQADEPACKPLVLAEPASASVPSDTATASAPPPPPVPSSEAAAKAPAPGKAPGAAPGPPPGKAKAAPPPCKAKAKAKASAKAKAPGGPQEEESKEGQAAARLVNLHWRASLEPRETELSASGDPYLGGVVDYLPKWGHSRSERCRQRLERYEKAAGLAGARGEAEAEEWQKVALIQAAATPAHPSRRRARRHTVFSGECNVEELSQHKLREFFQARCAAVDITARSSTSSGVSTLIGDAKHRQILDILVRKEAILRHPKLPQLAGVELAVEELVDALHRCDYDRLTPGMLEDLRKVAAAHAEGSQTVLGFVENRGEDALQELEHPHLHRLLFGVLKIPDVTKRLESMILEVNFPEHVELCRRNLTVVYEGLTALLGCLGPLRRFFASAMALGNALNQDSSASIATYGFKLQSLPKLLELRLPTRKECSLLHFTLLWLRPEEVQCLCNPKVLEALRKARAARSNTVLQGAVQLLEGYRGIQQQTSSGPAAGAAGGKLAKASEAFAKRMCGFAEEGKSEAGKVWSYACSVFRTYVQVAHFLDDSVLCPPPKDESEEKKDLFAVFHELLETMARVRTEVEDQKLPLEVACTYPNLSIPIMGGPVPSVAAPAAPGTPPRASPEKAQSKSSFSAKKEVFCATPAKFNVPPLWSDRRQLSPGREECATPGSVKKVPRLLLPSASATALEDHRSGEDAGLDAPGCGASSSSTPARVLKKSASTPETVPLLGPPPSRPAKRRDAAFGRMALSPPSRRGAQHAAAPPVTPTRMPPGRTPMAGPPPRTTPKAQSEGGCSTPIATPQRGEERTPVSPRTQQGRKSLTRIANRLASEFCGSDGSGDEDDDEDDAASCAAALEEEEPCIVDDVDNACSTCQGLSSPAGEQEAARPDLQAQIWQEMRRRRSRGRAGGASPQRGVLWGDVVECPGSPATPVRFYPLTPVKEQGETPYRLAGWQSSPC